MSGEGLIQLFIIVLVLIIVTSGGCGTLYPRTIITGGEAAGTVNRDKGFRFTAKPVALTAPAVLAHEKRSPFVLKFREGKP